MENKVFKLCYFSAHSMEIPSLSGGLELFQKRWGKIKVTARTGRQLFDNSRVAAFVKEALAADAVILVLHGGRASCPAFGPLVKAIEELRRSETRAPYLHIHPQGSDEDGLEAARRYADDFGSRAWDTINLYLVHGGRNNFCNLLGYLHNKVLGSRIDIQPPAGLPQEGIYHPDLEGPVEPETYLSEKIDPRKPTVGLWFYQSLWLNGNLAHIDALVREIERQGANALCVFHLRYKDKARGNRGAFYVADRFFKKDGKTIIDVLINPMLFSLTLPDKSCRRLLPDLDVPYIQAIVAMANRKLWEESLQGISTMDVAYAVAQPEFDGALITVPVATREETEIDPLTGALIARNRPIAERVAKCVRLALNWARLGRKPNSSRKVAIVLHNYPPRNDRIGCAAGLDSFESVNLLLEKMRHAGYKVAKTYADGTGLARAILERVTCDRRWLTADKLAERCQATACRKDFESWHADLPQSTRDKLEEDWGKVPGELFVHDDRLLFPGLVNGNVFIGIQPPRGKLENMAKAYHDFHLSPPHHYLAFYRWIKHSFGADAVIHVGKHGSLEWLPGKALGLSRRCYPDLAIMDLPNIYPYIINDPSEGTQAKRRSYCCIIDHLTPVFANADLYEELAALENLLAEYHQARRQDPGKLEVLRSMIWEEVEKASLDRDLEIDRQTALSSFDDFLERLHAYLSELGDTMIADGLHVLGRRPEGKQLAQYLVQLTRLENGDTPSLRRAILDAMGFSLEELEANRGKPVFGGRTGGQVIATAHAKALEMVQTLADREFARGAVFEVVLDKLGRAHPATMAALEYIAADLAPRIAQTTDELKSCLAALEGRFVKPGPSGAPTRGQADILPTGRNFFSVDPNKIPTRSAWETGKKLADALLERYLDQNGRYPDTIGIIVWGGSTMRTGGDDIAEIFYLMGLRPVWSKGSGNLRGLEVIPLDKLQRPRMDVVPRISGFFRDCFPNLVERLDEAARMVAALSEDPQDNILRRNVLRDMQDYRNQGMDEKKAFREATFRVFGCPPGTYGAGVAELIESKQWENQQDLGESYIRHTAHAYGRDSYGLRKPDGLRKLLSRMDLTVKNEDSREYDMFSCTDFYNYYGGLIVAAKTVRGRLPAAFVGDSADPERIRMRSTFEEARHVLRSRLTNPKWLEGLKRHGYKGAGDISKMMDVVLGWDATAEVVEDWMYAKIAEKYALDPEMQQWMKQVNPYALHNILDKLLEAIARGMWDADPEMEEKLREAYLEMEAEIEEWTE